MIAIDNVLVSDELVEEQFVCDLVKCKGGCCVDGDAGAPLEDAEHAQLDLAFEQVKHLLPAESLQEIATQGHYVYEEEFGWVTPTINGGVCVYALTDNKGIVKCSFEQVYNEGKTSWKKPISCHLFPARIKQSDDGTLDFVNYSPRPTLCAPACKLGKKLKVPAYQFLKEPLIRKYGTDFYEALDSVAQDYFEIQGK